MPVPAVPGARLRAASGPLGLLRTWRVMTEHSGDWHRDPSEPDITELVRAAASGDRGSLDALFEAVYSELKTVASSQRRAWGGNPTLHTTALVHEAYLKLVRQDQAGWKDRVHFFATAARAIRHILVNYAERHRAQKRGGDAEHVPLDAANPVPAASAEEVIVIHEALERLAELNERQCRVVECRFFGGLTVEETAEALAVSPSTVHRDWALGSAWLRHALGPEAAESSR